MFFQEQPQILANPEQINGRCFVVEPTVLNTRIIIPSYDNIPRYNKLCYVGLPNRVPKIKIEKRCIASNTRSIAFNQVCWIK